MLLGEHTWTLFPEIEAHQHRPRSAGWHEVSFVTFLFGERAVKTPLPAEAKLPEVFPLVAAGLAADKWRRKTGSSVMH